MKGDYNPSIVSLAYTTEEADKHFKNKCKEMGMNLREIKIYDIEIPLDKYNESINFLKEITDKNQLHYLIENIKNNFFLKKIVDKAINDRGFKFINPSFNWKTPYKIPYKHFQLTPVFYDMKYLEQCTTKEEKENYNNLSTMQSEGYKEQTLKEIGALTEEEFKSKEINKKGII